MTSNRTIKKGDDGVYRHHPSGNPCSAEFQKLMALRTGQALTAAQLALTHHLPLRWRAEDAVKKIRAVRAELAAESLPRHWRAQREIGRAHV